jgi:Sulfotransferase family
VAKRASLRPFSCHGKARDEADARRDRETCGKAASIKVIYIAGISHNGSTILGHILGEVQGLFYGGEVRNIWQRGMIENRLCGCGVQFRKCVFWSAVRDEGFPNLACTDVTNLAETHSRYARLMGWVWSSVTGCRGRKGDQALARYRASLEQLYCAIARVAGERAIVDSSKSPWYAEVLFASPAIDPNVVHLVRDPRAVVYSFMRRGRVAPVEIVARALRWTAWNLVIELVARVRSITYIRVRYEDLIERPEATVTRILNNSDVLPLSPLPVANGVVHLSPKHIFSGNRARGVVGDVSLVDDDEWRDNLPAAVEIGVLALTLPLFYRYGYRLHGGAIKRALTGRVRYSTIDDARRAPFER